MYPLLIQREDMLDQIQDSLAILKNRIKISTALGRTDMNKAAEDFYCGLLNIILGGFHLKNLNLLQMDFPAIDLADEEHRLCVQVTSTNDRKKIESTLQKFFENGLQHRFDRLIVLIIGEKKDYRKAFAVESGFDFDRGRDIWGTARLVQEINKLDDTAFGEVHAYLHTALNIPDASVPLHLPLHTSLGVDGFVGRQEELRALEKAIAEHAKPIILSGLGGMGKTELATHFGRRYGGGNVYLASFQKSFRETVTQSIAKGIPGLLEKKLQEDEVYKTVMNRLGQCVKDDILILDNVDRDTGSFADLRDDAYDDLCGLGMYLIMTTRFDVPRAIEIKQLSNSELHRIFQKHKVTISVQEMDALIQAVDGHTLTIDLMARTLNSRWKKVTADMLLKALQERNLPDQDFRKISTDYNRSKKQERIYEHLRTVFNVAGVPDAAKSVLCYATLLPQDGMDAETFGMALQEEEQQALDDLIDHGWLTVKDDILTIHPVVRLVCREELKPTGETCRVFLATLGQSDQYEDQYDASKLRQLAELYSVAAEDLTEHNDIWNNRAGYIWDKLGDIQKALFFYEKVLSQLLSNPYADNESIATAYCNASFSHGNLGHYETALYYALNSLNLRKLYLNPDDPNLATSFNNAGLAYADMDYLDDALKHLFQAILIWENTNPRDIRSCATGYSNIGHIYEERADYDNALRYKLKSLELWKQIYGNKDHPYLAIIHNNIAMTHNSKRNHFAALDHMMEALRICENTLPPNHHHFALCYGNTAETLLYLYRYDEAKSYIQKAIHAAKCSYPDNHPILEGYLHILETIEDAKKQRTTPLEAT